MQRSRTGFRHRSTSSKRPRQEPNTRVNVCALTALQNSGGSHSHNHHHSPPSNSRVFQRGIVMNDQNGHRQSPSSHLVRKQLISPQQRSDFHIAHRMLSSSSKSTTVESTLHSPTLAATPSYAPTITELLQGTDPQEDELLRVTRKQASYSFTVPPQPVSRPSLDLKSGILTGILDALRFYDDYQVPDYALLMDFSKKESLLGWKILTDAEMNGTSEASIAWGKATNPVTGEPMRTLVFQGRIGSILLPEDTFEKESQPSRLTQMFRRKNTPDTIEESVKRATLDPVSQSLHRSGDGDAADDEYKELQGFVGLMSPSFKPPLDLKRWDTYNICVRSDGGPWLASMKPETFKGNELFIAALPGPDGTAVYPRKVNGFMRQPMRNLFVPVEKMTISHLGTVASLSNASTDTPIEGFGLSIRGPPGPFKIEIGWIAMANSHSTTVRTTLVDTPDTKMKISITSSAIEHARTLTREEFSEFVRSKKKNMDALAKQRAYQTQQQIESRAFDKAVISVSELPSERRKNHISPLGMNFNDNGDDDDQDSAMFEAKLAEIQANAAKFTGYDRPLIVPSYDEERVMTEVKLAAVDRGLITQDQFDAEVDPSHRDNNVTYEDRVRAQEEQLKAQTTTLLSPQSNSQITEDYLKQLEEQYKDDPFSAAYIQEIRESLFKNNPPKL